MATENILPINITTETTSKLPSFDNVFIGSTIEINVEAGQIFFVEPQ